MKKNEVDRRLLEVLEKKIPDKSKLVEMLTETLFIEKGAVYRRLRGEVPFSFNEVAIISEKLNLAIVNLNDDKSEWLDSFSLDITGIDLSKWFNYISLINLAKNDPFSEFAASSNLLPATIYAKYESLYKFFIFKYLYLLETTENRRSYKEFILPENLKQMYQSYYHEPKFFAKTFYICDHSMIDNIVTDLNYFSGINLLSGDDLKRIKEDLFDFLDYFESIALNGCFDETGNMVEIYISDINLDASYTYMQLNDIRVSLVRTFVINAVMARDVTSFDKIKSWIHSLKRSSTLISRSGAAFRTEFFEKQSELIRTL